MYYFEKHTVKAAFDALKNNVENKFLGLLGIFKSIDSDEIKDNRTYSLLDGVLANWLDDVCYLDEYSGKYGTSTLYVKFSSKWHEYVKETFIKSSVSIYSLIIFLYKFKGFETIPSNRDLLLLFLKDYHLTLDPVLLWFTQEQLNIEYTETPVSRSFYKTFLQVGTPTLSFASPYSVAARAGELSRAPFIQTLYAGMDSIKCLLILKDNIDTYYNTSSQKQKTSKRDCFDGLGHSLQEIYYGAPGTGKSHEIDGMTNKDNSVRITFHPDTDYASFVGAYKPTMEEEDVYALDATGKTHMVEFPKKKKSIVYKFTPQALLQAYVSAWKWFIEDVENGNDIRPFYLVIEEINRGNCAQIFGDIFQMLDRSRNGYSSYAITPDFDIQQFLENDKRGFLNMTYTENREIKNDNGKTIATFENIKDGTLMVFPPNLHILATMNTSDQSLFPIDSAFKRRWDWKFMKIKDAQKGWKINFLKNDEGEEKIEWWDFIQKINQIIGDMTSSADKQLGYFFCKPDEKVNEGDHEPTLISQEKFVGKVLFYLWNDVFKDYGFDDADLFRYVVEEGGKNVEKEINFPAFYNDDNSVNAEVVKHFIDNVLKWDKNAKA